MRNEHAVLGQYVMDAYLARPKALRDICEDGNVCGERQTVGWNAISEGC